MRTFVFTSEQFVPAPRHVVFSFFADASNLERITPPWLRFRIVTPTPIEMRNGAIIDYRLRLHGIPLGWRSEIKRWNPPNAFVDEQIRGPYRSWIHTHSFQATADGTVIRDHVEYAVPGGRLVQRFLVEPDVVRVFAYRKRVIAEVFGAGDGGQEALARGR